MYSRPVRTQRSSCMHMRMGNRLLGPFQWHFCLRNLGQKQKRLFIARDHICSSHSITCCRIVFVCFGDQALLQDVKCPRRSIFRHWGNYLRSLRSFATRCFVGSEASASALHASDSRSWTSRKNIEMKPRIQSWMRDFDRDLSKLLKMLCAADASDVPIDFVLSSV